MRKVNVLQLLLVLLLCEFAYLLGTQAYSLAATPPQSRCEPPIPAEDKVVVELVKPSATPRITPTPRVPTPTPRPTPEWPGTAEIDEGETRCLARLAQSVMPANATFITKLVVFETVQNRVDSGEFKDSIRYTLLNRSEYPGYNPKARVTHENLDAATYAMLSWAEEKSGDRSHRYTPTTGVYICFSKDGRFVKVYDWDWKLVCDTSVFQ